MIGTSTNGASTNGADAQAALDQVARTVIATIVARPTLLASLPGVEIADFLELRLQFVWEAIRNLEHRSERIAIDSIHAEHVRIDEERGSRRHELAGRDYLHKLVADYAAYAPEREVTRALQGWAVRLRAAREARELAFADADKAKPGSQPRSSKRARAQRGGAQEFNERAVTVQNDRPMTLARAFRTVLGERDGRAIIVRWADIWWRFQGDRYIELDDERLIAELQQFLERTFVERTDDNGHTRRELVGSRRRTRAEVQEHLLSVLPLLGGSVPQWIERADDDGDPLHLIPCANGILDPRTRKLTAPTPRFFATTAINAPWIENAPEPTAWLAFLDSLWGRGDERVQTLREMFGYFLTPDTSQQKLFMLVGPKRSGKSTIARVLKALLGDDAVVNPTLSSLEGEFGLAPLVGRNLAIIGDARLGGRSDQAVVVERLLSISGEDPILVNRKNRDMVNLRLRTRVLLISNELPRLYDTSGALASRFILLQTHQSFYGAEDTTWERRLLGDLPGIFRWAVDGLEALRERGRFVQPAASAQALEDLEALGSPMSVFVRERCVVGPGNSIDIDELFKRHQQWSEENGREPISKTRFGIDLRSVCPTITVTQPRLGGGKRPRVYEGIGLA